MQMKEEYNDIDNLIISYLMGDLDNDSLLKLEQWSLESESNRMYVRSNLRSCSLPEYPATKPLLMWKKLLQGSRNG